MFYEEYIESLKKVYSAAQFRVPYTDAHDILKAIESRFIVYKDLREDLNNPGQHHRGWQEHIRNRRYVADLKAGQDWLSRLDPDAHYWFVTGNRTPSDQQHYVYDCQPIVIPDMAWLTATFFIVGKKYEWLCYFDFLENKKSGAIYASGPQKTPFDAA